eukprot:362766-Chlamydomonas_euryale.AAC.4
MTLTVKLTGAGRSLEIRTENAVEVTTTLSMDVDAFYDAQSTFIASVAAVLGIPESRIIIARVVAGSAVVTYELYDDPAASGGVLPNASPSVANNVDAETSAALLAMSDAERAALFDAYAADAAAALAEDEGLAAALNLSDAGSGGGSAAPSSPSVSQLAAMISSLAASVQTGQLAELLGVPVTALTVNTAAAVAGGALTTSDVINIQIATEAANSPAATPGSGGATGGGANGGGSPSGGGTTGGTTGDATGGGTGGMAGGSTGGSTGGGTSGSEPVASLGAESEDGGGVPTGAIVGAAAGAAVLAAVAAVVAVALLRKRRNAEAFGQEAAQVVDAPPGSGSGAAPHRSGPSRSALSLSSPKIQPSASSKVMESAAAGALRAALGDAPASPAAAAPHPDTPRSRASMDFGGSDNDGGGVETVHLVPASGSQPMSPASPARQHPVARVAFMPQTLPGWDESPRRSLSERGGRSPNGSPRGGGGSSEPATPGSGIGRHRARWGTDAADAAADDAAHTMVARSGGSFGSRLAAASPRVSGGIGSRGASAVHAAAGVQRSP